MSEPDEQKLTFNKLGSYQYPPTPTDESIRRFTWRVWEHFDDSDEDPFISDDSLKWANKRRMDAIAAPPGCRPIVDEMQATFAEWIDDDQPSRWLQLVVLPPGDTNDTVRSWAAEYGHCVIEPPERDKLLDRNHAHSFLCNDNDQLIVVPRLEDWFLRHQDGMHHVRELLKRMSGLQQHCVIGCNSWAWQFLDKAMGAGRLLPIGLSPNAFDAQRLQHWLTELAEEEDAEDRVFRLSETGAVVDIDYFEKLAAISLGIPWVAWQKWREGLRLGPSQKHSDQQKFPGEQTLWVSEFETNSLPEREIGITLLTLHALLIHGDLSSQELEMVLPSVDAANVLPSLVASDFIAIENERYRCVPAAYPTIRASLIDAGFPKDRL